MLYCEQRYLYEIFFYIKRILWQKGFYLNDRHDCVPVIISKIISKTIII